LQGREKDVFFIPDASNETSLRRLEDVSKSRLFLVFARRPLVLHLETSQGRLKDVTVSFKRLE